jgi:hypothetical protein
MSHFKAKSESLDISALLKLLEIQWRYLNAVGPPQIEGLRE